MYLYSSFNCSTMPPKSSTNTHHMNSRKQPGKSKSKKKRVHFNSKLRICRKQSETAKKSMASQKIPLTTMMETCVGDRSSLLCLLRRLLKEPKRPMERALWIPTSIKPSPVHRLSAPLPLLPCSLHRSASLKNVGSRQHLLSMLPFCTTMILCEFKF